MAVEYLERDWDRRMPEQELGWENKIRRRFEPKKVIGGVLFQTTAKHAQSVEIAGDFNCWVPQPLISRDKESLWQIVVPISDGKFRYKFIVDGEWQLDPYQPQRVANAHGCFDSYVEI